MRSAPMLVSVHLPKTAGTSFGRSLRDHFGDRLYRDYGDLPLNTPPFTRKLSATLNNLRILGRRFDQIACIHGHFLPIKYHLLRSMQAVRFVTWMRDPVERLASHYEFWKHERHPDNLPPLHRQVLEGDWSFERFFRSSELRNVYSQFLWGFRLSNFAFIGITEHYDEDFKFFAEAFLGTSLPPYRLRTNDSRENPRYVTDRHLRAEIEQLHERDMRLYRCALELRRLRTSPSRLPGGRSRR
jgi:hypothetical protein